MRNSFGSFVTVTLFGESHGEAIGAVVDGLPSGIEVNEDYIRNKLTQRAPFGSISTQRRESDSFSIVSGVFNGYTTGAPLTVIIKNENTVSSDYSYLTDTPRPSHADYTAGIKYGGYQDYRGGGHFSGRLTAPLVAIGAIAQSYLTKLGIKIGTHLASLGGVKDREFINFSEDISELAKKRFPVLDEVAAEDMTRVIEGAAKDGDSVGGVLECACIGVPAGLGEPWFDTVEGELAKAMLSIPGVKGVEFGLGFGFAEARGSRVNDPFTVENGKIRTLTNNNGGVNGGITNGMPIVFRVAIKPTPSIFKEQQTVSLSRMEQTTLTVRGRHDPCIAHRARAVVDAMCALTVLDLYMRRGGTGK